MEIWLATGDETGNWDISNRRFGSGSLGVACVIGPAAAWDRALGLTLDGVPVLEVFSSAFSERLEIRKESSKYHVSDLWNRIPDGDIPLDSEHGNACAERLRRDALWLIKESGLGVLAVCDDAQRVHRFGLGDSGDGMYERGRAFAALLSRVLPFLPGDTGFNLMAEGRTESPDADIVNSGGDERQPEPFRLFVDHLRLCLERSARSSAAIVAEGRVTDRFYVRGRGETARWLRGDLFRGFPLLHDHPDRAASAMNGIADLAAALAPRPPGKSRLVVPEGFSSNLLLCDFEALRDALV